MSQPNTTYSELDLDVRFADVGLEVPGVASEDCTGDGCGGTDDSAGTTC